MIGFAKWMAIGAIIYAVQVARAGFDGVAAVESHYVYSPFINTLL
jgi:hypothetical protein